MIKRTLLANYLGQTWVAVMGLAFIPVYVRNLGVEAYGLIGFYAVLQAWFSLFDLGMTPTITREAARFRSGAHTPESIRTLVRSFEVVVFSLAGLIAAGLWLASGAIASNWVNSESLPQTTVVQALAVMAFVVASRFGEGIYRGVLYGLECQVFYNTAYALLSTLRYAGAAVLVMIQPSLVAFFLWQALLSVITILVLGFRTYMVLPRAGIAGRFSMESIRSVGGFAGGLSLATIFALVFTQLDKVFLSRLVDLESFGFYMLALAVCGIFPMLAGPAASAFFPRFSAAAEAEDETEELHLFRLGTQIVSIFIVPLLAVCLLQGYQLMLGWTGDLDVARETGPVLQIVAIGAFCNAILQIPFMVQLAHGWTTISVKINFLGIVLLVPSIYVGIVNYGLQGAATAWAATNFVLLSVYIVLLRKRILRSELVQFLLQTILLPLALSICCIWVAKMYLPDVADGRLGNLLMVLLGGILSLAVTLVTLPVGRSLMGRLTGRPAVSESV